MMADNSKGNVSWDKKVKRLVKGSQRKTNLDLKNRVYFAES